MKGLTFRNAQQYGLFTYIWEVFGVNVGTGKGLTLSAWFTCFACWCRLAMAEFFVAKFPKIATVSGLHTTPNFKGLFEYKGAPEIRYG